MAYQRSSKGKEKKRNITCGVVHIYSTFNNTLVTLTDVQGNVLCWSSSGGAGFKGARKSTPYAAQLASEAITQKGKNFGLKSVEVYIKGPGSGRESALRALKGGFNVTSIRDVTPMPHNGCRLPKKRRG
ncbi:30S ribosomal protein S11 [Candidatus Hepatobacter penaei]|jgi:small subunit ribosomal protein S11|uniref:30S ribosomal protein S11 n=1 Tax=Candidatus Hepatobacter penaei TaxID=1274402 RepID=UPI0004F26A52|nr:30S ribosomal protein S11 [Candidatus Hepatobacter penaei]TGW15910.1 30S ribosomal protein S11 [bacterium NHP-B]